jgi:uncharacterized membrane protein YfcA
MALVVLVGALLIVEVALLAFLLRAGSAARQLKPRGEAIVLGSITNFFDTLGIGSFAPTMAWMKFRKLVPDRLMPMTMLAGYTPPSILQAIIFLILLGVHVDLWLLLGSAAALVAGAFAGAPVAARSRVRVIQAVVSGALMMAALFYVLANLNLMPLGGTANSLPLALSLIVIAANFVFGMLLNFGVGNYAPTLAMLSLFGMDPRLAFPIMAGGAAFAGSTATVRLVKLTAIDMRIVLGLTLGAIPAVLVAAFVVKEMPVTMLRWLVVVVVLYAAATLLREAMKGGRDPSPELGLERAVID